MSIEGELFTDAIHLFGLFHENPPPSKGTTLTWRRLENATTRIYRSVGAGVVNDPDALRTLRRTCIRCLKLLEDVVESRHYHEAAVRLNAVIILVDECLYDRGVIGPRS